MKRGVNDSDVGYYWDDQWNGPSPCTNHSRQQDEDEKESEKKTTEQLFRIDLILILRYRKKDRKKGYESSQKVYLQFDRRQD